MSTVHSWLPLALALLAFVLSHLLPTIPSIRTRLISVCGRRLYFTVYGMVSFGLLLGLIGAASSAPYLDLWSATEQLLWAPRIAMPAAVVLAVYGFAMPNPLSLTMNRRAPFDPARPGVVGVARHPVLWAMTIWSLAHIFANGDLAHVVLFSTFAAMSLTSMAAIDRRRQASLGAREWNRLSTLAPALPMVPSLLAGWRPKPSTKDFWPFMAGISIFALLAACHGWFAGVPAYS